MMQCKMIRWETGEFKILFSILKMEDFNLNIYHKTQLLYMIDEKPLCGGIQISLQKMVIALLALWLLSITCSSGMDYRCPCACDMTYQCCYSYPCYYPYPTDNCCSCQYLYAPQLYYPCGYPCPYGYPCTSCSTPCVDCSYPYPPPYPMVYPY